MSSFVHFNSHKKYYTVLASSILTTNLFIPKQLFVYNFSKVVKRRTLWLADGLIYSVIMEDLHYILNQIGHQVCLRFINLFFNSFVLREINCLFIKYFQLLEMFKQSRFISFLLLFWWHFWWLCQESGHRFVYILSALCFQFKKPNCLHFFRDSLPLQVWLWVCLLEEVH